MQLLAKGAYEQALVVAEADIEADGSDGAAYYVAARASLLLSNTSAAIDYSLLALANGQTTSSTYSGPGVAYIQNKEWLWPTLPFGRQLSWTQQALKCTSIWPWFQK